MPPPKDPVKYEEYIKKQSESHMNKLSPMKGKHFSSEFCKKMSIVKKGKHYSPTTEFKKGMIPWNKGKKVVKISNENSPHWKGGKKLRIARMNAKRRQLGHIYLNDCSIDGWVGHHIDWDYVIFYPLEVHLSVPGHSVIKDKKMDEINGKVYEWFVEYYIGVN